MTTTKGFRVYVYRDAGRIGDCTNGGASGRCDRLTVLHPDLPGIFEASDEAPAFELRKGNGGRRWILVPAGLPDQDAGAVHGMFGGNYAASSDSRWSRLIGDPGVVPIHDRSESWANYHRNFD